MARIGQGRPPGTTAACMETGAGGGSRIRRGVAEGAGYSTRTGDADRRASGTPYWQVVPECGCDSDHVIIREAGARQTVRTTDRLLPECGARRMGSRGENGAGRSYLVELCRGMGPAPRVLGWRTPDELTNASSTYWDASSAARKGIVVRTVQDEREASQQRARTSVPKSRPH